MTGKDRWWEFALKKFEPTLPPELRKDLDYIFALTHHREEDEIILKQQILTRKVSKSVHDALEDGEESKSYQLDEVEDNYLELKE